jgi:hypothetical protein
MGYDELGTMNSFTYVWEGGESTINSWDQTNEYEGDALISFLRIHRSADRQVSQTREYTEGLLARLTQEQWASGTWSSYSMKLARKGELVSVMTYEREGQVTGTVSAEYDDGYLTVVDMDGTGFGIGDGMPDIRQRWEYDEERRIIRFEQDGTTINDNPYIDGIPDDTVVFEPECAEIAVYPEALYRLPNWLAPRPGSGMPL